MGQLASGLAHDFNNLLTGISGSLDLLQRRVAQGRINDLDRYIIAGQEASKRAAALNHESVAGPRGGAWSRSTISGNGARGSGIINDELSSARWCGTASATRSTRTRTNGARS